MPGWLQGLFSFLKPAPLKVMQRGANSSNPEERREAAEGLAEIDDPAAGTLLVDLLRDTHSTVKAAARNSLIRKGTAVGPALIEGLTHPAEDVSRTSAELAGELRIEEAVEPLLRSLKFGTRPTQLAAKKALIQIGSPAVSALEAVRDEPQPWVQKQIEEALAEIRA